MRRAIAASFLCVGVAACGKAEGASAASDAGVHDAAGTDSGRCTDDAQCPSQKCNRHGECVSPDWCETDEDCPEDRPACHDYFGCSLCGGANQHCPEELPACLPDWEGNGLACVQCAVGGDPSQCPGGTWCAPLSNWGGLQGSCEIPNCENAPSGLACMACKWANSAPCLQAGGECEASVAALCDCLLENGATCQAPTQRYLEIGVVTACHPAAAAVDDCVLGCGPAVSACALGDGGS